MSFSRSFVLSVLFSGTALFAACDSAPSEVEDEGTNNPPIKTDGGSSGGKKDSGAATPPKKDSGTNPGPRDGSTDDEDDAAADASPDPVWDGGPTMVAPAPGVACTVVGEKFTRTCGACGSQVAVCSASRIVTGYGACRDAEGECVPGTRVEGAACGACGTTTRVCNAECAFISEACTGETGACVAGRTEQRQANCATGLTKMYECTDACAWQVQTGATCTGTAAFPFRDIGTTVGSTVVVPVTAAEQVRGPRNFYTTCSALSAQQVFGRFIELLNPTDKVARIDVWSTIASDPNRDTVMISYDEPPFAAGDLIAACTAVNDTCAVAPYSATSDACLAGSQAVVIPANGRRWVYVGNFSNSAAAVAINVNVKTISLQ